jgi:sterol desaturase/sphingolipid hydroxylase (fatty acid hydroxylase superfamily)
VTQSHSLDERGRPNTVNFWGNFAIDLVVLAGFAWLGATRYPGARAGAAAFVVVGFFLWPFLEYWFHRWFLHGRISLFRKAHARHHGHPRVTVGAPWYAHTLLGLSLWAVLAAILSGAMSALLIAGVYTGYTWFRIMHRLAHYHPELGGRWWLLGRQLRFHEVHHFRPEVNFGVSTSIWDRVFGTSKVP